MKRSNKATAVFLSIIMMLSVFAVGGVGIVKVKALTANGDVYLYVPECVYLNPVTRSYAVWDGKGSTVMIQAHQGQFYLNSYSDENDETLGTTDNEGYIYFHKDGAYDISISCQSLFYNEATGEGAFSSDGFVKCSLDVSKQGDTLYATVSDLHVEENHYFNNLVKWTVNYLLNGEKRSITSYSFIYAPNKYPVGSIAQSSYYSDYINNGQHYFNLHANIEQINVSWGMHKIRKDGDWSNYNNFEHSESYDWGECLMLGEGMAANDLFSDFPLNSADLNAYVTGQFGPYNFNYNTIGGDNSNATCTQSPEAQLKVDCSRFSNFSQVPNLKAGFAILNTDGEEIPQNVKYSMSFAKGNITGATGNTGNVISETQCGEGKFFGIITEDQTFDFTIDLNKNQSAYYTVTTYADFEWKYLQETYCHNTFYVTNNDKSDLRKVYLNALKRGYDESDFNENQQYAFGKYLEALLEVAVALGDPEADLQEKMPDLTQLTDPEFGEAYTLTVVNPGENGTTTVTGFPNTPVEITAGTKEGYTFDSWTELSAGTISNDHSESATYIFGDSDATIKIIWTQKKDDSDSSITIGNWWREILQRILELIKRIKDWLKL